MLTNLIKKCSLKMLGLLLFSVIGYIARAQDTVDDSDFLKAGIVHADSSSKTYPIRLWDDFILVDGKVNGVAGAFIWDNGVSFCALDSVFAEKAGARFSRFHKDSVLDANDRKLALEAQYVHKIQVGDFVVEKSPAFDLNIDHGFFQNREQTIAGLIGSGFSNHFNWFFDFDNKTVTVSSKPIVKQGIVLKYSIDPDNNLHYMPISLNGADMLAQVDFGMVGDVFSGTDQLMPLFEGYPLIMAVGHSSISAGGLNRVDTTYTIRGDYSYLLSGQQITEQPDIELNGSEFGFRIGARFFMHYNITINNSDSTYILSPRLTPFPFKTKKGYGVFVLKKGKELFIGKLTTNPNLEGKKLRLEERIETINGKTAEDFYGIIDLRDYQERLANEGKPIVLKMANGSIYTFTPQDDIAE